MVRGRSQHRREQRVPVTEQMPLLLPLLLPLLPAQHCVRSDGRTCRSDLHFLWSLP